MAASPAQASGFMPIPSWRPRYGAAFRDRPFRTRTLRSLTKDTFYGFTERGIIKTPPSSVAPVASTPFPRVPEKGAAKNDEPERRGTARSDRQQWHHGCPTGAGRRNFDPACGAALVAANPGSREEPPRPDSPRTKPPHSEKKTGSACPAHRDSSGAGSIVALMR